LHSPIGLTWFGCLFVERL